MNKVLSDLFHVKGRFRRSVHLERDFYTDENLLEGYVVTVTAREMLERVVSALENNQSSKAWSVTGPYGSGKSAFALFTANLLGNPDSSTTKQALALLKQGDTLLHQRLTNIQRNGKLSSSGFCPVLISGERAPISVALLRGLQRGLISFNGLSEKKSPLPKIKTLLKASEEGNLPNSNEIIKLFKSAMHQIEEDGGTGLLLVIDEFGKFLEYVSQYPAQSDIHVLQELAEFAERSGKTPLFLVTILHQAFEMYGQRTTKLQREEWAKIQERFENVPFIEPTEQLLRLIGKALEKSSEITYKNNLNTVIKLGLKLHQLDDSKFIQLLDSCLPLHPIVALLIGPLFRRFAQNERSLFAFLNSNEPYGLQDFLSNQHYEDDRLPMYRLANLYDYFSITQGNKLYTSGTGKKWAEIESAINRLPDPSEITVKLIKTIGLLSIAGEAINGLKASKKLLHYALNDNSETFTEEFHSALTKLEKHSIIIYRRYNDTFAIWEGSDIDIEARLREAETQVDRKVALATNLSRYMSARPLVATQHLFETGTLRYFTIRYTDLANFNADLEEPFDDADGLLLYALPASEQEAEDLHKRVKKVNKEKVLIAIPDSIGLLQETVFEIVRLRWVQQNTSELQSDNAARRELSARILETETDVSSELKAIFDEDNEKACHWYHKGREKPISTRSVRNGYLSKICKEVYKKTPILKNELINRRKISGTVTAARRELIQAMLENSDEKNLGITGHPPEMSIYQSLLRDTRIHRRESGVWGFYRPKKSNKSKILPTWEKIEEFFEECEVERQSIETLYDRLMERPFGMRIGPLPILLCAAVLCYKTEVAFYENGSFVADLSMPVFERLLKAPEKFELKRFRMTDYRTDALVQYLDVLDDFLDQTSNTNTPNLLAVATPLMLFVIRLPKYTLTTQTLSEDAENLRKVVLDAREPDELLFTQLPKAFRLPAFGTETSTNSETIPKFFNTLQETLLELKGAYNVLLNYIEKFLVEAFALPATKEELRAELVARSEPLLTVTIEIDLKGFLIQVCSGGHDHMGWLEAIATYLAKKPPSTWVDADKAQFEINLSQIARKFRHFEAVSYEKLEHTESLAGEPIRVGITTPNRTEQERVVTLTPTADEQATEMEDEIKKVFDTFDVDDNPELHIAILARISQKWMQQLDE